MMRPPLFMCFSAACAATMVAREVEVNHVVHLFHRGVLEPFRNCGAGVVHQDVEPAEGCHRLFDGVFDCVVVLGVGLNRDGLSASLFDRADDRRGSVRAFGVGDGDLRSVGGEALRNRGTDATRCSVIRATFPCS